MRRSFFKSKIHRATITEADLNYEGSISIDPALCEAANLLEYERVEIYDCNNGNRFATYVIYGRAGEICVNGAAAHLNKPGDLVILATFADLTPEEARHHKPVVVLDPTGVLAPLKELTDNLAAAGVVRQIALDTITWTTTIDHALDACAAEFVG